jgi:NAD(P)-dependent dehydrogenase (short-subunit alcohol dehydrogenase family)
MKTAFITGVGSGIGQATCLLFLEKGWRVIGVLRKKNQADGLRSLSAKFAGKLDLIMVDLMDANFESKIRQALFGFKIDDIEVLLNVAGTLNSKNIEEVTNDYLQEIMTVNFNAPVMIIKTLIPWLKKSERASITNISSMSGFQGSVRFPGLSIYGASKAALNSFSESLSAELNDVEITINALAIGSVNTEMLQKAFPGYKSEIEPNEIADYIFSFASSGSRFFNGKVLPVAITNP